MTTTTVPIAAGRDFYVPAFEVRLLDEADKLPQAVQRDILQVTYRDGFDLIPQADLTVNNWDVGRREFKYSDADLFDPGRELTVAMGYHGSGELRTMINATIVSCRPSFPAGGAPTLTVSAQSTLMRKLQQDKNVMDPGKRTDSAIVRDIAGRLNLPAPRFDPAAQAAETEYEDARQENESTLDYLLRRARRLDYEVVAEELGGGRSRLYFGPTSGLATVVHKLAWGSTLSDFQPALDTLDQVGVVTVYGWDPVRGQRVEGEAKRADLNLRTVGTRQAQTTVEDSFAGRREFVDDPQVRTTQQAKQRALAVLRENAKRLLTATGTVVGLPDLRAGAAVEVDKVGTRFQGRYVVTATTHTLGGGGYTTQFECRHE